MIGDRVRSLVRKALRPNFRKALRPNVSPVLFLLFVGCWAIAWSRLDSDLSKMPSNMRAIYQDWIVSAEEMHEVERCLWANGVYTVSATNVTLVKPTSEVIIPGADADQGRERLVVFPSGIDGDLSERNPVRPHLMQPVLAIPFTAKSDPGVYVSRNFHDVHDQIKLAKTYFRGKRTTVFKTKRPRKYFCRAVLQEDVRISHDGSQVGYLSFECNEHVCTRYQHAFPTLLPTPPQRRSIWCEELTATEIATYHGCRKHVREDQENSLITLMKVRRSPKLVLEAYAWPFVQAYFSFRDAIFELLGLKYPKVHAFLPMMGAEVEFFTWSSIILLHCMEFYIFISMYFVADSAIINILATPDCSSEQEEDSKETEQSQEWLVAASHRLNDHLEDLMEGEIITEQQYVDLVDLQMRRGRMYIHAHLRHFVVSNGTVAQLKRYVVNAGINIPDGYESQTSSDSDSTHETSTHPLLITTVSQLFTTAQEGFNFEFALEKEFITKHQFARIYDTLRARGPFSAAQMLIRRVSRNHKRKEFLHWLSTMLQVPSTEIRRIAKSLPTAYRRQVRSLHLSKIVLHLSKMAPDGVFALNAFNFVLLAFEYDFQYAFALFEL